MTVIPLASATMHEPHSSDDHVLDRLSDLIEGDLSDRDRAAVESHLAQCPGCRDVLHELKQTIDLLSRLPKRFRPADHTD